MKKYNAYAREDLETFSIRIGKQQKRDLRLLAADMDTSVQYLLIHMLDRYLEDPDVKEDLKAVLN